MNAFEKFHSLPVGTLFTPTTPVTGNKTIDNEHWRKIDKFNAQSMVNGEVRVWLSDAMTAPATADK